MNARVENRLADVRKSRGVGAADLARRVNVSRQTIYAIEAGTYVPNTEVALHLARELEVTVDQLFSLQEGSLANPEPLTAEVLSASPPEPGQPVRLCRIGSRWIGVPVTASPYYLPEADGIVTRTGRAQGRADLMVFAKGRQRPKSASCWRDAIRQPDFSRAWWKRPAASRSSPPRHQANWR